MWFSHIRILPAPQKRPFIYILNPRCGRMPRPPPAPRPPPKRAGELGCARGWLLYCAMVGFIYHYFKEQWQCCQFRIQHFDWHVYQRSVSIVSAGIVRCHFLGFIFLQAGCLCTRAYRNLPYKLI